MGGRTTQPLVLVAITLGVALAGCGSSRPGATSPSNPVAEGRTIFTQGIGPDGRHIPRSGPTRGMMMGRAMMQAGCAACHGVGATGRSTVMFEAPNITYANLTATAGMREPSGERGPTYTDAQFCRAVVQGVDPTGDSLSQWMPRWHLDSGECAALIAYLKTLR